jgi:hypothetical protein
MLTHFLDPVGGMSGLSAAISGHQARIDRTAVYSGGSGMKLGSAGLSLSLRVLVCSGLVGHYAVVGARARALAGRIVRSAAQPELSFSQLPVVEFVPISQSAMLYPPEAVAVLMATPSTSSLQLTWP